RADEIREAADLREGDALLPGDESRRRALHRLADRSEARLELDLASRRARARRDRDEGAASDPKGVGVLLCDRVDRLARRCRHGDDLEEALVSADDARKPEPLEAEEAFVRLDAVVGEDLARGDRDIADLEPARAETAADADR